MEVIREIYRGDIFYVMPGPAYSADIGTKGRPAVIVSPAPDRSRCETVNVVYLTTRPQAPASTHVPIHSSAYPSTAICEQINTVHIDRLGNFFAALTDEEMEAVDRALIAALGLDQRESTQDAPEEKAPVTAGGGFLPRRPSWPGSWKRSGRGMRSCSSCTTNYWTGLTLNGQGEAQDERQ